MFNHIFFGDLNPHFNSPSTAFEAVPHQTLLLWNPPSINSPSLKWNFLVAPAPFEENVFFPTSCTFAYWEKIILQYFLHF